MKRVMLLPMQITWWMWIIVALGLALAEMAAPSFFMIFLSVGALVAGLLLLAEPSLALWAQLLVFSAVSLLSILLFRKPVMKRLGLNKPVPSRDEIVNETAVALGEIAPGGMGQAELRGTVWTARNGGETALAKGRRCRVEKVEGLTLWLRAE